MRFGEERATWISLGLLALILIRLAVFDRTLAESATLANPRFAAFAASAVAFWLVAKWTSTARAALAVYIAGHAILLSGLSMEIESWATRTAAHENLASVVTAGVSIMLAAYAVSMIGVGAWTATTVNRLLGLSLIGLVILKLYLYDVWLLARLYRTIAFVALGALLVLSSYVYSRYRDRIESLWRERS